MKEPYFEAQANFIKAYPKTERILIGQNDECVFFTLDGYVLHIIPNEYNLLDIKNVLGNREPIKDAVIKQFTNLDYAPAMLTGYKPHNKWKEVAIIENENLSVWVQKKFLKEFPSDVTFYITNEKTAVQVRFNGDICGYILPVRKD